MVLVFALFLGFAGCGSNGPEQAETENSSITEATADTTEATEAVIDAAETTEATAASGTETQATADPEVSEVVKPSSQEPPAAADPPAKAEQPEKSPAANQSPVTSSPVVTTPPATEPPHTHNYSVSGTTPAGCESQGYTTYSCACGSSYQDNYTTALGHSYNSTVVAATYEAGGYTQHTCTRCASSYTSDETPKLEVAALDYEAAMAYGNQYAANTYGWIVEHTLNASNAGYYFPDSGSIGSYQNSGGQSALNQAVVNNINYLYDARVRATGSGDGYCVNCHVYEENGTVFIYVYYG